MAPPHTRFNRLAYLISLILVRHSTRNANTSRMQALITAVAGSPTTSATVARQERADRHRAEEHQRVDPHHPPAHLVGDLGLHHGVGDVVDHHKAPADADHRQQRQRQGRG